MSRTCSRSGPAGALTLVALALAAGGCGEKSEPAAQEPAASAPAADAPGDGEPNGASPQSGDGPSAADRRAARRRADERRVERTVEAYVAGLDHRDGRRVCALLAPGVVDELELPHQRGSCAASLDASIGYRDPRGLPQFRGISLSQISAIDLGRKSARATTSIVTSFADRSEPSIEDDLVYLQRRGERWLIAKPSSALYRAIGAEPGPRVIVPPG